MGKKEDWLRVIFVKESNEPEAAPVSFVEDRGDYCIGILEMELEQDFGCRKGDEIEFFAYSEENEKPVLICDMNLRKHYSEDELEDGKLLKEAISVFNNERSERNFLGVLQLLRDSYIWVPCNAVMSDADQKRLEELLETHNGNLESLMETEFVAHDKTRLIPDILQNGDLYFFPVFSATEEMGEYGDGFSKVEKHFFEALTLANNNEKELAGIVVNAFTEPFVVDRDLWDFIVNMKSRLVE